MKNEYLVKSGKKEFRIDINSATTLSGNIDGKKFDLNISKTKTGYHVLRENKAYKVDIVSIDKKEKKIELRINNKFYSYEIKDKFDELLDKLGMSSHIKGKIDEIKAPMPGLVLDVLVSVGDVIKANQPLIILEAMKMENVIKSSVESTLKKIEVKKGDSVEKNQVLLTFN